jgi:flagellar basal-body rod modification protein FlgD
MSTINALSFSASAQAADSKSSTPPRTEPLASKDAFLQLLVAQMRHQDPLQPSDGVQFLSQLAQFSGLEQSIQLNQEVQSVREAVEALTDLIKQSIEQQGEPTA